MPDHGTRRRRNRLDHLDALAIDDQTIGKPPDEEKARDPDSKERRRPQRQHVGDDKPGRP